MTALELIDDELRKLSDERTLLNQRYALIGFKEVPPTGHRPQIPSAATVISGELEFFQTDVEGRARSIDCETAALLRLKFRCAEPAPKPAIDPDTRTERPNGSRATWDSAPAVARCVETKRPKGETKWPKKRTTKE